MSTLMTLGAPEEKDGKLYIKVSKTSAGCVVWGPYQHLHQGTYSVQFEIAPEDSADAGAICCKIDIVADLGKSLIFERSLSARELRESGHVIDVKFSIQHASLVEYRIWTTGTAELRVAYDRMATAIPGETDFAYSSLNRQKWLLLFNCQTFGLTNCMNSLQDVVRVDGIDIWKYTNDIPHITAMLPAYDLVIIEPGFLRIPGADFGRAREILQLPSMEFFGFHPDLCYLYRDGRPVTGGAIEAYHSMIAFCAYQKGYSVIHTEELFNDTVYRDCGYYEYYAEEKAELIQIYKDSGFDLIRYFPRWSKLGAFMHTSNHPKIHCLLDLAKLIFERRDVPIFDGNFIPQDNLIVGPCFPVYPEIASALGVPGSYLFKRSQEFRLLRLHEFLTTSFAFYDRFESGSIQIGDKFRQKLGVVNKVI